MLVAESFFKILKFELVRHLKFYSILQAKNELFEFLEIWYNRKRKHQHLGYKTPEQHGKINYSKCAQPFVQFFVAIPASRSFDTDTFGIEVPLTVVPGKINVILNPQYPYYLKKLKVSNIEPLSLDERFLKK